MSDQNNNSNAQPVRQRAGGGPAVTKETLKTAKRLLGYVPEMPAVYDLLTVSEHLEFIGRAYRLENWQQDADRLL